MAYTSAQIVQAVPIPAAPEPSGVVQVKSTTKSDTFSSSSTSLVDITGLSVSITPTSASNKVLVNFSINFAATQGQNHVQLVLLRNSTQIGIGDASGVKSRLTAGNMASVPGDGNGVVNVMFLDSPATTSATTYKVQMMTSFGYAVYFNRNIPDLSDSFNPRSISTITVMEVTP